MVKRSIGERVFEILNNLFMVLIIIVMIYPLLNVIFSSFSNYYELMRFKGILMWPIGFNVESYKEVFKNRLLLSGFKNTFFVVGVGTSLNMFLTILGAYALSKDYLMFRKPIMLFIIFTMYFSGGMIPLYLVVKNLGLIDSLFAVILPNAITTYNMILLRNGFRNVPKSLEESAKIDGANEFTILFRIVVPLSMSIIAVIILYYAVAHWNSWFNASIYLRSQEKYPLQLILRMILMDGDTGSMTSGANAADRLAISETLKYTVITVTTIPILCVYPFLQKYFVTGVMTGSVKE